MSAEPPVLALREARIAFGGPPLFEDLSVGLDRRERACLVGRNGSGKSTLLKALAGLVELDAGARFAQPGLRVSYLAQDQTFAAGETVAAFVGTGLAPGPEGPGSEAPGSEDHGSEVGTHQYRVAEILDHLQLAGGRQASELSGGEARRAALARALVGAPEVLLLDEPTNHLDLPTIEWLETYLGTFPGALLVVSHDRAFLTRLSRRTLWLVGGGLRRKDDGFAGFEPWSEKLLADEAKVAARLDKRLAAEIRWLHHGITARRKRNQGRLHRLQDLRRERAARPRGPITVRLKTGTPGHAGRLVIDAEALTKSFAVTGPGNESPGKAGNGSPGGESPGKDGTRVVVHDFTTRILKGDRVGIVGPNGAGKTTLLRLLTGDLAPDSGQLRLGAGVRLAYFDQHRTALDPAKTLWETLCEAGGDTVFVGTKRRHVVGYLKDFLFKESQAKSPVASLSGGERNRLLLAKILAGRANLLVLDEPTNDLDMDTLDLLQEMLAEYEGTLLLVSHDRDFLDRVVTSIIAVEGDGRVAEYVGGYDDYLRQRPAVAAPSPVARRGGGAGPKKPAAKKAPTGRKPRPQRLGYREQRELAELPDRIEALSREAKEVEARLHDPALYARDRAAFEAAAARSAALRQELAQAEARWLALEARREEIEAAKADGDAARAGPVRPAP